MIIKKVLNNNLLLVESENGKEQIAMGKGLRFSYKVGERLRETDVEKIYMLKDEKNTQDYIRLLQDVPASYGCAPAQCGHPPGSPSPRSSGKARLR